MDTPAAPAVFTKLVAHRLIVVLQVTELSLAVPNPLANRLIKHHDLITLLILEGFLLRYISKFLQFLIIDMRLQVIYAALQYPRKVVIKLNGHEILSQVKPSFFDLND